MSALRDGLIGFLMRASEQVARILTETEDAWRRLPSRYQAAGEAWTRADPHVVHHELLRVAGRRPRFLEWGSGIGTHCLMADAMGIEAHGIEIDAMLLATARQLAANMNAGSVFAQGSFIPPGVALPAEDEDEPSEFLFAAGSDGHAVLAEALARSTKSSDRPHGDDTASVAALFDVIYAYPAPRHIDWFAALFRDIARVGAVFWCYTETAGILSSTKVGPRTITPLRPA